MILLDTSVWVEFVRGTASPATQHVRAHVGSDSTTTCEPVLMELLAGARAGAQTLRLERLLLAQPWLRVESVVDYRVAVDVFHAARGIGHPIRSLQDCLIAAIALRHGATVAHRDGDYEHIAAATGLSTKDLR